MSPFACILKFVKNTLSLSSVICVDLDFGFAVLLAPCVFMRGFGDNKNLCHCHFSMVGLLKGLVVVPLRSFVSLPDCFQSLLC